MANPGHLEILKQGIEVWNNWRIEHESVKADLRDANLHGTDLGGADLRGADLRWADLSGANLQNANLGEGFLNEADLHGAILRDANLHGTDLGGADLRGADLRWADLSGANLQNANLGEGLLRGADLHRADLRGADLSGANLHNAKLGEGLLHGADLHGADLHESILTGANFHGADLHGAILRGAILSKAILRKTNLSGADLGQARLSFTIFSLLDLSTAKGLNTCAHDGPSSLDTHTLLHCKNIPEVFLRGCGLPDNLITYLPSLFQMSAIQFYSCFLSHSTKDNLFAERLFNDLQGKGVRTWYAPEEMKGGEKLYDQIDSAIRLHDKLLLVLSEHSLKSEWVLTEIRRCRKSEKREGKRKLFPIRLVDMGTIQDWECFDADSGKDLAVEVREFFLPDFSNWKDHDAYKKAFDRLLRDLKESAEQD